MMAKGFLQSKFIKVLQRHGFRQDSCVRMLLLPNALRTHCSLTNTFKGNMSRMLLFDIHSPKYVCLSERNLFSSPKKEEFFKKRDKVSNDFTLIYKTSMDNYLVYGQRVIAAGILGLLGIGLNELYYLNIPHNVYSEGFIQSHTEFLMLYVALACTIVSIQSFILKFPLRIYHNSSNESYIAVFVNLFGLSSKLNFTKGQIEKVKSKGYLPWKDDRFSIQSKKVILLPHFFRLPADYNMFLNVKSERDS